MTWSRIIRDGPRKMTQKGIATNLTDLKSTSLQTPSHIDHWALSRDVETASPVHLTGIVCELGQSSYEPTTLDAMIRNGMTIAKINCSKVPYESNAKLIDRFRTAAKNHSETLGIRMPVAVALETRGVHTGAPHHEEEDIRWGLKQGIDMVFVTATENAERIGAIKEILAEGGENVKIFAKIENSLGWKNIDSILDAADGIFIGRDELSRSILPEKVFLAQKSIVSCCNEMGKPVLVGGQVLESMIATCRPSRCETTDIFTAVLDGADCVELSVETAHGGYPKETVASLCAICREVEVYIPHHQIFLDRTYKVQEPLDASHASAISAIKAAFQIQAKSIICITRSGKTALLMAKYSPPCPVVAVAQDPQVAKDLLPYRGILPIVCEDMSESDWILKFDSNVKYGVKYGLTFNFLKAGDPIIVISDWKKSPGFTDAIRIVIENVDHYMEK